MSIAAPLAATPPVAIRFLDRCAKRFLARHLTTLRQGRLTVTDSAGTSHFGQPGDLRATVQVHHPRLYRQAILGGTLSIAESYLNGDWDCDDLTALLRLFVRNMDSADRMDRGWSRLAQLGHRWYHWWHANSRSGSRRNIGAHYDLGNDFFRLWLDETMAYSAGVFSHARATLHDASVEKFDRICRKLDLSPADHVLEIGTGWGGFALHAAQRYGCRVTTTTISRQQWELARQRIDAAGLDGQINLLQQDYRDLTGQYDQLVSIEMIEAVGHQYLDRYFSKCSQLLRADGSFVLQAIVMPEQGYDVYLRSVDFIQRYVFPGGCLPAVSTIMQAVGRATDLRLVHVEDLAPHYAETLRQWRLAFHERLDEVRQLGYPERFLRLWHYYLCYCEAVFAERHVGVVQMQLDKPRCRRDPLGVGQRAARALSCDSYATADSSYVGS